MELAYLFDLLAYSADSDFLRRFATPEFGKLRITLRGPAIGSAEATQSVAGIEARAREIFSEGYRVVSTGTFYRLAQESDRIVEDQVRSFVLAFVMVAVAIGFAFRSWRLLAASMLPNLVPIVGAVGLMGFLGIDQITHFFAGSFICRGGLLTQVVYPTMNIAVVCRVVFLNATNHRKRTLRSGGIVQIH